MEVTLVDLFGDKAAKKVKINEQIFASEIRYDIIKQVINWQRSKAQTGNHKTKVVSEISGTTAKPFRQKGTGRARQGSLRSAQFRGGATIFGPVPRSHATKLPKKVRQYGLRSALSYLFANERITFLLTPEIKTPKTKALVDKIDSKQKNLIILDLKNAHSLAKSVRNLVNVNLLDERGINVFDIIKADHIYLTESALPILEERLC